MAQKTPEQIADKYQRGVSAGAQDYAAGVQNPTKSWASATAAAQRRWANGVQAAMQNGSFARGVQAAGDAKWQQRAASIGAQRYAAAAPDAAAAYAQKAAQIVAAGNAARAAANQISGDTQEARIQRAVNSMRATSDYWKNRARGG